MPNVPWGPILRAEDGHFFFAFYDVTSSLSRVLVRLGDGAYQERPLLTANFQVSQFAVDESTGRLFMVGGDGEGTVEVEGMDKETMCAGGCGAQLVDYEINNASGKRWYVANETLVHYVEESE